jgi:hypothetical protein
MSSPLDGRIRTLARAEAAALLEGAAGTGTPAGAERAAELAKEVAELRATVQQLGARLDALAKTAGHTDQEERAAARRTRKAAE